MTEKCECKCGYTCKGPGYCELPLMECIEKHWVKDCGHDFTGPWRKLHNGGSVTCKHCGITASGHDMIVGP